MNASNQHNKYCFQLVIGVRLAKSPDTIVIGAGVIGLSCAFQLAKSGKKVLVLERGTDSMRTLLLK